jgi:hypothetical protein
VIEWIVFYDDHSSYTSEDGPPESAPKEGVQLIAQCDQGCGLRWIQNRDYYCWHRNHRNGCWLGHNGMGYRRYLYWTARGQESGVVLTGYELPDEIFYALATAAYADPRLPQKTAAHPGEEAAD